MEKRILAKGADFLTEDAFLAHSVTVDATADKLEYTGIPLDYLGENRYASTRKEQHTIIVGDTGCGKTRRLIVPAIKLIGKTGESMIISDPKGELYQKTSQGLKAKGYEIRVLNMREPRNGDRWNPLELIETMYKSEDENMRDKGLIMLDEIIDQMATCIESSKDKYWETVSKQFIKATALTILDYAPEGSLNFRNLALACNDIMSSLCKNLDNNSSSTEDEDYSENDHFICFYECLPADSLIRQNFASTVCVNHPTTMSCISTTMLSIVNMYTRQESIKFLFSKTDFDIRSLGQKSIALYILLPDELLTLYPLATLFVSQIYSVLIDLAFTNGGTLPNKVNFILDEFANFTRMPNISSMLTSSRSRGIRFFLVVQDIEQLRLQYGDAASSIVYSNCPNLIFMGCRNVTFLKELMELSGLYTEAYTGISRPLISINDLQCLEVGEAFIYVRSCNPKHSKFPDYTKVDFGEALSESFCTPPENQALLDKPLNIWKVFSGEITKEDSHADDAKNIVRRNSIYLTNEILAFMQDLLKKPELELEDSSELQIQNRLLKQCLRALASKYRVEAFEATTYLKDCISEPDEFDDLDSDQLF